MPGGDYSMDHSALIFLVNSKAQIVGFLSPPFDTRSLTQDLLAVAPHLDAKS
jgi:cytochrome oxidase Cu insertion factor (SCO1/SenC/PrrC family)